MSGLMDGFSRFTVSLNDMFSVNKMMMMTMTKLINFTIMQSYNLYMHKC